ncbi:MAG: hypothetical protein GPJ52_02565 [Candidatus Heimdallarchaeota archaeon]|nr:hypothetical protein [Candidatus Heimdallarchaeota archaeon]
MANKKEVKKPEKKKLEEKKSEVTKLEKKVVSEKKKPPKAIASRQSTRRRTPSISTSQTTRTHKNLGDLSYRYRMEYRKRKKRRI